MAKVDCVREKPALDSKAVTKACDDVLKDCASTEARHFLSKSKATGNALLLTVQRVQRPSGVLLMDLDRYAPVLHATAARLREMGEGSIENLGGRIHSLMYDTVEDLDDLSWQEVSVDSVKITIL